MHWLAVELYRRLGAAVCRKSVDGYVMEATGLRELT
jgi:hypothetical protein